MRTTEGSVVLCPACPKTGTYIGPLITPGEQGNIRQFSPEMSDYVVLYDEDGGTSQAVHLKQSVIALPELGDDDEAEIGISLERHMFDRIGKCAAGTLCSPADCPAWNGDVLNQVITEEHNKVAARANEEG